MDNGDDTYTVTIKNLPTYYKGEKTEYTVKEETIEGYTQTQIDCSTKEGSEPNVTNTDVTLTNKHLPPKPLLKVKKITDVETASPGDVIPYDIIITNDGDADISDVVVLDLMGNDLTYVSDDSNGIVDGNTVRWNIDLSARSTRVISIECRIKASAAGKVVNKVRITNVKEEYIDDTGAEDTAVLGIYKTGRSADTGDDTNIMFWVLLLLGACATIAPMTVRRNRRNHR